jgi:translocation and assembly module TamA
LKHPCPFLLPVVAFVAMASTAVANPLRVEVRGLDDPLRGNVLAHIGTRSLGQPETLSPSSRAEIIERGTLDAYAALRPFGYYAPSIDARVTTSADGNHTLELRIDAGEPVRIRQSRIELTGPGSERPSLMDWRASNVLTPGTVLDQAAWEALKAEGLRVAREAGFFDAAYSTSEIALDLIANAADLMLIMDSGPSWVMGRIDFGEHVLRPGVLDVLPRFEPGEPYRKTLVERLRLDLQQSGYFTDVEIMEIRNPETAPPSIDIRLRLVTEYRNRYQGSIGFGSDTGLRLQTNFTRQPMSGRGDRIEAGIGWRETDEQLALRTAYRIPRRGLRQRYWTADGTFRQENRDLEVKRNDEDKGFIPIANGNVDEFNVRFGQLYVRNQDAGDRQILTTLFGQVVTSRNQYEAFVVEGASGGQPGSIADIARGRDSAASVGVDLRRVDVSGRGFDAVGGREALWLFTSVYTIEGTTGFTQAYLNSHRTYRVGQRSRVLVRGEVGYTDADVEQVILDIEGEPLELSVTRLPNFYRFRAGGSTSVRGYGFEQLSNNNIGSNNILTASVEFETRVFGNWSAAAFADIGNAFNDWSDPELKRGAGVGIRWYSFAGPIRLDVAQALDFTGRPWRVHFTIGSPLL